MNVNRLIRHSRENYKLCQTAKQSMILLIPAFSSGIRVYFDI